MMRRIALALFLTILGCSMAGARAILIRPDGTGDFPNIRAGILAAASGDTVLLADGVFTGDGNRDLEFYGRELTLLSQSGDPRRCAIDCLHEPQHRAIYLHSQEGPGTLIQGITIRGGNMREISFPGGQGAGILCHNASPTIRRCIFEDNMAQSGAGLYAWVGSFRVEDCIFWDNTALLAGGGIDALECDIVIERSVFTGNWTYAGGGVALDVDCIGTVSDCTIAGNKANYYGGGLAGYFANAWVERTILWDNCAPQGSQIWLNPAPARFGCCCFPEDGVFGWQYVTLDGEQVWEDPRFCGPLSCGAAPTTGGEYTLDAASPCLPGTSPCGMRIGALGVDCGISAVGPDDPALRPGRAGLRLEAVNPIRSRILCSVSAPAAGAVTARLLDASGRQVAGPFTREIASGAAKLELPLDGSLANGWYLLVVEQRGVRAATPVVRIR